MTVRLRISAQIRSYVTAAYSASNRERKLKVVASHRASSQYDGTRADTGSM